MARKPEERKGGEKQLKQLTLKLSDDLHLRLKLKCVREGRTMGEVLTEAVKKYVES
jgi:predicted DNA-binding protein